ncbi:hypothetical protein LWV33_07770 [Brucella intermedia]
MFPTADEFLEWMPALLGGLKISLQVAALSLAIGIPLGLLLALGVGAKTRMARIVSLFLVEIGRAPQRWFCCSSCISAYLRQA